MMTSVEDPRNTSTKQENNGNKNKTAMKIVKATGGGGGGGIGVGLVFFGGAVATAAFFFIKKQMKRDPKTSNNGRDCDNKGHLHHQSTPSLEIPYKLIEDKYMNEDNKGLRFVAANSSPDSDADQDLVIRNGEHDQNGTNMISEEVTICLDEKEKLKVNGKKEENPVADVKDVEPSISPEELDSSRQSDSSNLMQKEFQNPILVEEKMLPQPNILENELATPEIEEENADGSPLLDDQGVEEECQHVSMNNESEEMDSNIREDEGKRGLENQEIHDEAEASPSDQKKLQVMQSSEELESPTNGDETSTSTGDLVLSTCELSGKVSLQPLSGNPSLSNDGNIGNEESAQKIKVVVFEKDEEPEAADQEQDKGDISATIIEVEDELHPEHVKKQDASFNEHGNGNPSLMVAEIETDCNPNDSELDGTNEEQYKSDAFSGIMEVEDALCPKHVEKQNDSFEDQENGYPSLIVPEIEEDCNQDDSSLTIRTEAALEVTNEFQGEGNDTVIQMPQERENSSKCQVGVLLISEALEVAEEVQVHKELKGGDQHDAEVTGGPSQDTRETDQLPEDHTPATNPQELQMDTVETSLAGHKEDNSGIDEPTSEVSPCEESREEVPNLFSTSSNTPNLKPEIHVDNGFEETHQSAEANEMKEGIAESESSFKDKIAECDGLPVQQDDEYRNSSEEAESTVQLRNETNVATEEQTVEVTTEEDANEETDELNVTEKVEESSEGTADSSAESNPKPIWPSESIQDLTMDLEETDANDSKEILQPPNEEQTVEKQVQHLKNLDHNGVKENKLQRGSDENGSLQLSLLEKYRMQLVEMTPQTTKSQKRIILAFATMAFSGLCTWHFGLPFLKICLMIIMIAVIAKMDEI
ncbi:OLC1v1004296C1 [Oldenlandia corymbosa var. corymbosa]|uniref:OLC1v1004296C1 n=1 Tax=Oldenlandia corymbosa var. corymbosa TaxID=529605 RepID=A0AAV1DBY0_OLDCO|nr:OLC1v1004296C1 [Oldenlandia corymbosa var. corymbosa]